MFFCIVGNNSSLIFPTQAKLPQPSLHVYSFDIPVIVLNIAIIHNAIFGAVGDLFTQKITVAYL